MPKTLGPFQNHSPTCQKAAEHSALLELLSRRPAAHLLDAARVYRLGLEKTDSGARYHAVAEERARSRHRSGHRSRRECARGAIAPEDAAGHFGWLGTFLGWDLSASSARTRERLGWNPTGPPLLTDLENMPYSDRVHRQKWRNRRPNARQCRGICGSLHRPRIRTRRRAARSKRLTSARPLGEFGPILGSPAIPSRAAGD